LKHDSKSMDVMVVDDDPTTVALLERHLRDCGYVVFSAADGAEAVKLMRQRHPDIVVLDWILPGMDGPAVCREIRKATEPGRYTFVIMLTIHSDKPRIVEAFEAGVDDFLSKPFDRGELLARCHAAVRTIALQKELARRERRATRLNARLARLNDRLRQLAMTDDLTGLLNRREAVRRLTHAWALSERYRHPIACAMIDVDDFKRMNDKLGHASGDELLRAVAQTMQSTIRTTDAVCRYGGDEFLIFFPHQNAETAAKAADRLRRAVGGLRLPTDGSPVTLSIGIAERDERMTSFHDLLDRADRALYHAKKIGKDLVWIDGSHPRSLAV